MFGRLKRAIRGASQDVKLVRTFLNWRAFRVAERRRDDGETILETRTGLRMAIRHNKWDAKIMREQFLDRYYLTGFRGPIGRPPVVVDVGSYIGDFALYCAHELGAQVVAYEPTGENFAMLERNLGLNPHLFGRVTAVNRGVASTPEVVANVQVIGREIHASSAWYGHANAVEKRTFACDSLPQILERHRLDKVDLLKIDCEGGEYDVIPAAPLAFYDRVDSIVYEWHKTPGYEPKLEEVERKLRAAGFEVSRVGQIGYATRS